ncbi:MAG: hypothetical protein ACR2IF_18600 [Terriglobales bacterium]
MNKRVTQVGVSLLGGLVVFIAGISVDVALLPHDRTAIVHELIANTITALIAVVIALAIQLRYEERYYRFAVERAASMAELNHNVRNAVFPLCLAVQRSGDAESDRLARESMARLDIALRDAAVDAYSGKVQYAVKPAGRAIAA